MDKNSPVSVRKAWIEGMNSELRARLLAMGKPIKELGIPVRFTADGAFEGMAGHYTLGMSETGQVWFEATDLYREYLARKAKDFDPAIRGFSDAEVSAGAIKIMTDELGGKTLQAFGVRDIKEDD